jgi:hypothetical protein
MVSHYDEIAVSARIDVRIGLLDALLQSWREEDLPNRCRQRDSVLADVLPALLADIDMTRDHAARQRLLAVIAVDVLEGVNDGSHDGGLSRLTVAEVLEGNHGLW